jgi:hypothetical protein
MAFGKDSGPHRGHGHWSRNSISGHGGKQTILCAYFTPLILQELILGLAAFNQTEQGRQQGFDPFSDFV